MTVRELREILSQFDDQDALVVVLTPEGMRNPHVEADPEGNVFISQGDVNYYELP